jgi:hypothetical protein
MNAGRLAVEHMKEFQKRPLSAATWRAAVATVASTLLLVADSYHILWGDRLLTRTLLYLVVPLGIVLLVFREHPARYGVQLGDWRAGLRWTLGACAGLAALMAFVARTPSFREYYGAAASGRLFWLADGAELLGWEFFFRGFLLFALYRACGPLALLLAGGPVHDGPHREAGTGDAQLHLRRGRLRLHRLADPLISVPVPHPLVSGLFHRGDGGYGRLRGYLPCQGDNCGAA